MRGARGGYAGSARSSSMDQLLAERMSAAAEPMSRERSEKLRRIRSRIKGLKARSVGPDEGERA